MRNINILINDETYTNLKQFADKMGVSLSDVVRNHLDFAISQRID